MNSLQRTYYLILSLFWLATALPMALIVLLAQARGLDLFQVGLLMAIYSLTIVLLEVPTGGLADVIGRKRVAVLAYSCTAAASLTLLLAFSFPVFLIAFILNGIGRALSSGALEAWFIDAVQAVEPEADLQPILAKAGTFSLLALGSGVLLGSALPYLFEELPPDGLAILTPFSVPLLLAGVIHLLTLLSTVGLVRERRPAGGNRNGWSGLAEVPIMIGMAFRLSRRNPTILLLLGATFASGLAIISLETLWQPHFAGLIGGSAGHSLFFGLVMAGNFMAGMVGNLLATPLNRWLNRRYGLVCAIFQGIRGLVLILLAWQTATPPAVTLFWLVYLNMGVVNSPHSALLHREIPAGQRSSILSIESLAGYLGAIVGSAGLGYVAEYTSINLAWTIGGAVLMISLSLYWQVDARRQESHVQEALILETR